MNIEEASWQYKGFLLPHEVTKKTMDALQDFKVRDDDIVVASYPKTGTNWLAEIVVKILQAAGKTEDSANSLVVGPIEATLPPAVQPGYIRLEEMPSPRLLITHLPIQLAPQGIAKPQKKVKVLMPMRNPKDTVVSGFHFANKMLQLRGLKMAIPWEHFAELFITGKLPWGDYCEYLLGWWQMRDNPHFLFLKYEDMKKDLLSAVNTIVTFLEIDLDESTIKDIAEASTFSNMKPDLDNADAPERKVIARKGIVGDWKNMFSPEQSKAYDAWYEKKLSGTGITFDFE